MSAELDIYDLEGVLEEGLAKVLRTFDLVISTPNSDEFQKERPRVDLTAMVMSGMGRPYIENCVQPSIGQLREKAWKIQFKLDVITAADITAHRAYRAKVRNKMAKVCPLLNEQIPNHDIHSCKDAGSSTVYKGQDGVYQSTLIYEADVQVTDSAMAALILEES